MLLQNHFPTFRTKQEVLLSQIQNDNKKLQDVLEDADLNEMVNIYLIFT